ncbi:hypothetical protein Ancab_039933 [Ancistrocladus abbreviatus]
MVNMLNLARGRHLTPLASIILTRQCNHVTRMEHKRQYGSVSQHGTEDVFRLTKWNRTGIPKIFDSIRNKTNIKHTKSPQIAAKTFQVEIHIVNQSGPLTNTF